MHLFLAFLTVIVLPLACLCFAIAACFGVYALFWLAWCHAVASPLGWTHPGYWQFIGITFALAVAVGSVACFVLALKGKHP